MVGNTSIRKKIVDAEFQIMRHCDVNRPHIQTFSSLLLAHVAENGGSEVVAVGDDLESLVVYLSEIAHSSNILLTHLPSVSACCILLIASTAFSEVVQHVCRQVFFVLKNTDNSLFDEQSCIEMLHSVFFDEAFEVNNQDFLRPAFRQLLLQTHRKLHRVIL